VAFNNVQAKHVVK